MRLLVAVLLLGCHGSRVAPVAHHEQGHTASAFNVASVERYERGDGVPRDFRTAAKLYAEACGGGCGDLAACHGLLELAIASRGITPALEDMPTAVRMCKRGDDTACVALALLGFDKGVRMPEHFECRPGDHIGCEAAMWMDVNLRLPPIDDPPEPPTADELHHQMTGPAAQLCAMGVADGCMHVVGTCGDRACIDRFAARLQDAGVDSSPLLFAWQAIDRACTAGDVDACDHAGRPLPAADLCAAGDDDACGHDRIKTIKALQSQVAALVTSCRASDHVACDRLSALTAAECH